MLSGSNRLQRGIRLLTYITENILTARLLKFGIVGATGVAVNMGCLYLLTEFGGVPYFLASIVAIELSILSNFTVNNLWTWRDRRDSGSLGGKFVRYHLAVGVTAFAGNYLILVALTELAGIHYLISNLAGIAVGTFANYLLNDLWTFRKRHGDIPPSRKQD